MSYRIEEDLCVSQLHRWDTRDVDLHEAKSIIFRSREVRYGLLK